MDVCQEVEDSEQEPEAKFEKMAKMLINNNYDSYKDQR